MQITIDPFWKSLDIEDDIILIATLYDAYGKEENIGEIVVLDTSEAEKYFEESCSTASVKRIETIKKFITKKILSILDPKRFPVRDEKRKVNIYKVKINWLELNKYASILHDTESRPPYGIQKQAIILKDLIIKVAQKLKLNKFEVTEKILGSYMAELLDDDTFIHYERPDYYIAFVKSVIRLQEIRFLKILDMRFDFNAWPTPTHAKGVFDDYVPTGVPASFYPAEHCHILIEINPTGESIFDIKTVKTVSQKMQPESSIKSQLKISFKKTSYNRNSAILTINGINIQIPSNTNQDDLCRVIFSDKEAMIKKWESIDVANDEAWGERRKDDDTEFPKKIYNAAHEINIKIATETGIKKFLLTKPIITVQINPIYLPSSKSSF